MSEQRNTNVTKAANSPNQAKKTPRFDRSKGHKSKRFADRPKDDFEEKVIEIRRVTKVTKGGRSFKFSIAVVVGNKKGKVGLGTGKAREVPEAIKKGNAKARKNLVSVPLHQTTVPHDHIGHYGAGKVFIKPARKGTGVIAGGPVRAVMELAGISDVSAKSLGSSTPINMVRATIKGLQEMVTFDSIQELRFGKSKNTPQVFDKNSKTQAKSQIESKK